MQKLTLFSLLLSISVILIVGDIVYHDYLSDFEAAVPEDTEPISLEGTAEDTSEITLISDEETVALSEEPETLILPGVLESSLSAELFKQAGFIQPVLKDTLFSGLVFQFISFADQSEATVYQWNVFDGEQYIGSVYELKYPTETGSFQGYLALRERAMSLTDLGTVNEVNNYGDASFYFNHKTKVKTVHLVVRTGNDIFGFEYSQTYHEKLKNVFDSLSPLL